MPRQPLQERVDALERFQTQLLSWTTTPKPVLAAVEGAAAGGGVAIIAASDWAVAATDARIVAGWPAIGLAPDLGAAWSLVRTVGSKRAYDWLLAGGRLSAVDALAHGLLSAVVEPGSTLEAAIAAAERILRIPPPARAATKELLRSAHAVTDPEAFRLLERDVLTDLFQTPEHRAAVDTFLRRT
jgi:enoyl-CoA hydratase/carnithine racemase